MKIEAFLETHLLLYYFILFLFLGISIFLNKPKEKRNSQTKIAKFYIIYTILSTLSILTAYAFEDIPMTSVNELTVFIYLAILIFMLIAEYYHVVTLGVIILGMFLKLKEKKEISFSTSYETSGTYTSGSYIPPSLTNNSEKKQNEKKENFLIRVCYNKDNSVNEKGILLSKLALVILVALIIIYVTFPIFVHFDIKMFFSRVALLLFIITFMELYFALQGTAQVTKEDKKKPEEASALKIALKSILRLIETEKLNLNDKMIGKKDIALNSPSALICEVPNLNELREINLKVMNSAFFENKKVLVLCLNEKKAKEYHSKLTTYNKEYDGKLVLKLITNDDKLFDSSVEIFVTSIENCFGNIKLLSQIDTIIIEDYDEILLNKLEQLRAIGSIVKMGNPKMDYIIFTYMLQGIEATIKNLLFVNEISCYCKENKQQPSEITLNVWEKNDNFITEKVLGSPTKNIGSLVPLSLLSVRWEPDRVLLLSKNEPLTFELNELNAIRNLYEKNFKNTELKKLGEKTVISTKLKDFSYSKRNWIVADDKSNLYEKIYKLSLINGVENNVNIVSEQYLLRDYMIETYKENKTRLKGFLPYVPYEVNSGSVNLYNLLLQLTNFGVKENIIVNILKENGIEITLGKGNNVRIVADKLNYFIKKVFNMDVDIYSYINLKEIKDKYVFDITKKKYIEEEKIYILDEQALKLFPDEIFSKVSFVKDGFELDIEKEYAYNFYQKYLPGQKHFFDGYVYEIKNVIDTEDGKNAILEASTNYDNNTYRQDRKVDFINNFVAKESKINRYSNVLLKYQMGQADYKIRTEGYYEFKNGISKIPGEYRYVGLDENNISKTIRNHIASDAIKIEFSNLRKKTQEEIMRQQFEMEDLAQRIAFLMSEVLATMLGENAKYVQVKAVKQKREVDLSSETWVSPIEDENYRGESIEIYILEDTKIERGLIDMIYKNLDNIFNIICEYLEWVLKETTSLESKVIKEKFLLGVERDENCLKEYRKILTILSNSTM